MRQQMDDEISSARREAHKATEELKTAEDRVRSQERAEMAKMESEYQKRISMLGLELERVRQELIIRTKLLSEEMERWRQQAEFTAAAVIEAKAEVTERKRDLDSTRDKMDRLMDRLHVGREHGLVLQASLTAANAYTTQAQRTLIHSMESSFQNNVQQTLPWNGQISGTHELVSADLVDPMTILNRGMEIKSTKPTTKPRMLENTKQSIRTKQTRTARRGRG